MKTITIRLRELDLSREMAAMRAWLDHHGCEPIRFECTQHDDSMVLMVVFMIDAEADAFAVRFEGDPGRAEPEAEIGGLVPDLPRSRWWPAPVPYEDGA